MTDYSKMVKALRHCVTRSNGCVTCAGCPMSSENGDVIECINALHKDSAAAIEALLKENQELIEDHPEMVEADGHWEWRKPNGEVLLPKREEVWKDVIGYAPTVEPASPWHRVEDGLPKEAGEYIVAYHPCHWDNVVTKVTKVGIDNFRGKLAWAKKKFQRVTHWMEKPEPPKEDA